MLELTVCETFVCSYSHVNDHNVPISTAAPHLEDYFLRICFEVWRHQANVLVVVPTIIEFAFMHKSASDSTLLMLAWIFCVLSGAFKHLGIVSLASSTQGGC